MGHMRDAPVTERIQIVEEGHNPAGVGARCGGEDTAPPALSRIGVQIAYSARNTSAVASVRTPNRAKLSMAWA